MTEVLQLSTLQRILGVKMKAYSIFDDFTPEAVSVLKKSGIELTVHPLGVPRPNDVQMKKILEENDCVIIGTSQKITPDMFENVTGKRIIATASVGLDHINLPNNSKEKVIIINTPKANAQSVAEYTMGCALSCVKRLQEGSALYALGKNNKALSNKPEDMAGKTIGVIGAGNISAKIMDYAILFGMKPIYWTAHPERHLEIAERGIQFVSLEELAKQSDVISVNLPNNEGTAGLISADLIQQMKESAIFISVSRLQTIDYDALFFKAEENPNFYVCLDIDVNDNVVRRKPDLFNVLVTPHIAGGTVETRKRMFLELANQIADIV